MPYKANKPCSYPGCGMLTTNRYCHKHKKDNSNYRHTLSSTQRGYGAAWRKLREHVFRRDSKLCQNCLKEGRITEATVVDHIKPKAIGGTDDMDNLQSLCRKCHDHKTATIDSKY